jgi:hypothetical protein
MSYRCSICGDAQPHGQKLKRWVVLRPNRQIEREIPVCADCHAGLKSGYSVEEVRRLVGADVIEIPTALAHLPSTVNGTANAPPVKTLPGKK